MNTFPIIVISGLPCTGKTTLGRYLSQKLSLPFIYKDGIKELLFDNLGALDSAWSKKLGVTSMALLYQFAETEISAGKPFIIESHFRHEFDTEKFLALQAKYTFSLIQIFCHADGEAALERFKKRDNSAERHPGHIDPTRYKEFEELFLRVPQRPLEIGGKTLQLDTTDLSSIQYDSILAEVQKVFAIL